MKFSFPLFYPYSFFHTTKRLRTFEKSSYRYENGIFRRTIRGQNGPLLLEISCDKEESALQVKIKGAYCDGEKEGLRKKVAHMFSAEVDLRPFYEQLGKDPVLSPIIEERKGMHFVLDADLHECLLKTIIGQQLNVSFAATLTDRLVELAGDVAEFEGERWTVFPTPEQVARLEYEQLQALQFNRRKAEYIIDIARMIVSGELDLDELYHYTDEEVMERLLPIRGIGRWTVECVMLFGLGRPNLLPAQDIGLRNAVKQVYALEERPDEKTVRRLGQSWSPYASYVTFYLWDMLGNQNKYGKSD
ncbi:DNA-3-methyladenine glycosylase family protein [Thermoactinomyces mirandus]|uniref:DNA-3-methyladenine glycosylase II n=1 Tax=Thermoactinomyces mirandus TaxID=2756294 RepID=A0A7W2AQ36_9BACL|nr:DNA-3-methyladenine glycosylase [Thermoactinomyces mirandus]MBA4601073.1 DNA-3-methyladenine glycosylase 2 family protein [Thermoactinomyces mirandus]